MTPADRYEAVIAKLTEGFDGEADRNEKRVEQLEAEVKELGKELKVASDLHVVPGSVTSWHGRTRRRSSGRSRG